MLKDRVALDLPYYDGLLAGHHFKEEGYTLRRASGTDDWLLVATVAGAGRFTAGIKELEARPGSVALLAPRTPHDYGTARDSSVWEIFWVHFEPPRHWLELLHWPMADFGVALFEPNHRVWQSVAKGFRETLDLSLSAGRRRREFAMNALERLLLTCEDALPQGGQPLDERISIAIGHALGHLQEPLTVERLSALVHLSPSRFAHLFRKETGMPPLRYVHLQRMRRARTLLKRTSHSVSEIAAEIGMEPFHFSTRFKGETGLSPRAYRTSHDSAAWPRPQRTRIE